MSNNDNTEKEQDSLSAESCMGIAMGIAALVIGCIGLFLAWPESQLSQRYLNATATAVAHTTLVAGITKTPASPLVTPTHIPVTITWQSVTPDHTATIEIPPSTIPSHSPVTVTPLPIMTNTPLTLAYDGTTLRITEVMANPCGVSSASDATGNEYIEIYNYGSEPVDVNGWNLRIFADGYEFLNGIVSWATREDTNKDIVEGMITTTTIIPSKEYGIILSPTYPDPDMINQYSFPMEVVLLTIDGSVTRIGNVKHGIVAGDHEIIENIAIIQLKKGMNVIASYTARLQLPECYSAELVDLSESTPVWVPHIDGTPGESCSCPTANTADD